MKLLTLFLVLLLSMGMLNAVVKNENKPTKGEWNFDLREVWSVDSAGGNPLARVRNIMADENGNVFLVDRKFKKIIAFNSKGKEILCFGRHGEGPGEILRFGTFFLKGPHIIVDDRGNRLHYFTKKGEYKNTFRYDHSLIPKTFIKDHRFVAIRNNLEDVKRKENETLEIVDVKTRKREIITSMKPEEMADGSHGSGKNQVRVSVFVAELTPSVVVGTDGKSLLFGMNDEYLIRKTDFSGKELFSFSLAGRKPKPVSMETKKALFKSSGRLSPQMIKSIVDNLPGHCTYFSTIHVDDTGLIYVYVTDMSNEKGQELDIFSSTGKYLYHSVITFPDGHQGITSPVIAGDYLYVYTEDDEEEPKLIKYKIKKPARLF